MSASFFESEAMEFSDILGFVSEAELKGTVDGPRVQFNFLRNFTIEGVEPFLKYHSISSGLVPSVAFGDYDVVRQEIMDPDSHFNSTLPDLVIMALHIENYIPNWWENSWNSTDIMDDLSAMFLDASRRTASLIAVNTFVPPYYADYGISRSRSSHSSYDQILLLNQLIREFVQSNTSRFVLVDWERMVRLLGENESMDYRFWYMSKSPFKNKFLNHYAYELVKIARALKGKAKKCVVLDCDNTLWGGVVGEDGLQGIKLDRHSYPGNIYYDFQKRILRLYERGVLITLCSKNNEKDVWEVLDKHPHSLIKREHLSAWRINWGDKATNIRELASELNLGLDSLVFVDDSDTECGLVRDLVTDVTVLKVPKKLYSYPLILDREGLFDTLALSEEDKQRTKMYQDDVSRKIEQSKYDSIDQYLASLSLCISVHLAKPDEVPRIAQLTQKTNQFNLTTRRYSEPQIEEFLADPASAVITLSVHDKFGDSGLTGILIAKRNNSSVEIDTFLMSCRILGRNIEIAFLLRAFEILEGCWGACEWKAKYIPSPKNQQVHGFWERFHFSKTGTIDNQTDYILSSTTTRPEKVSFISIVEE